MHNRHVTVVAVIADVAVVAAVAEGVVVTESTVAYVVIIVASRGGLLTRRIQRCLVRLCH